MARARKPWVRGAVVIGIAGAMMAAALMSPALAVRLATTSYVKQKVNQAFNATFGEFLQTPIFTVRSEPIAIGASPAFVVASIGCPAGGAATGGGATGDNLVANFQMEASYPSNGATSAAGTTGWTVSMQNEGGTATSFRVYVLCGGGSSSANYTPGSTPFRASAAAWPPSANFKPEVTTKVFSR